MLHGCVTHIPKDNYFLSIGINLILDEQEGSAQNVIGDVYRDITPKLFAQLDRYEGDVYDRKIIQVTPISGSTLQVYAYIYNQSVDLKNKSCCHSTG